MLNRVIENENHDIEIVSLANEIATTYSNKIIDLSRPDLHRGVHYTIDKLVKELKDNLYINTTKNKKIIFKNDNEYEIIDNN